MKNKLNRYAFTGVVLVGALASVMSFKGSADLVLDEEAVEAKSEGEVEERETTRKVVKKSKEVETTRKIVTDAAESSSSGRSHDYDEESSLAPSAKSELVRRKRMREEMKNEDLLQQRLEELRLRDEEKRTKKVLKSTDPEDDAAEEARREEKKTELKKLSKLRDGHDRDDRVLESEVELEFEIVQAPANERNTPAYQMSPAPSTGVTDKVRSGRSARDQDLSPAPMSNHRNGSSNSSKNSGKGESTSYADDYSSSSSSTGLSIIPRFGFSSISNQDLEFSPKFSVGLGLGFDVSENVGIEFGYTFSEVGIRSPNSYGATYGANYGAGYGASDELNYRQHIFDALMKLYFTDTSSRIRPFVGGGMGYSMGTINYSDRIQQVNNQYGVPTQDYELKSFIGVLTAGLDIKVADKVSIGGAYRFMRPLSSTESQSLNTGAFYPQAYDYTRDYVSSTLRDSNIHILQLGATFSF